MEFGSILFLCFFFPLFYLVYYILPDKWKNSWLCIGSIFFVICGRNFFIWYFLLITGITYFIMLKLNKLPKKISKKKIIIWISLIEFLIFFLFVKNMKHDQMIIYPICYTIILLSNIGTLFDFYQNKRKVPKLFHYILYVSCFSKLLFGPVLSYYQMDEEIKVRKIKKEHITNGCFLFLKGLFQNVLLVVMLSTLNRELQVISTILASWLLLITTMLQITLFMMSYSNMSLGLSTMLGFSFAPETTYPLCLSKLKHFFSSFHASIFNWWNQKLSPLKKKLPILVQMILFVILFSFSYGFGYQLILWFLWISLGIVLEQFVISNKQLSKKVFHIFHIIWLMLSFIVLVKPNILNTITSLFQFTKVPLWDAKTIYLLNAYAIILIISLLINLKIFKKIFKNVEQKTWYYVLKIIGYFACLWMTLIALISGIDSTVWIFRI